MHTLVELTDLSTPGPDSFQTERQKSASSASQETCVHQHMVWSSQGACSVMTFEMKIDKRQMCYVYSLPMYKKDRFPSLAFKSPLDWTDQSNIYVLLSHKQAFFLSFYPHGSNSYIQWKLNKLGRQTLFSHSSNEVYCVGLKNGVYCTILLC